MRPSAAWASTAAAGRPSCSATPSGPAGLLQATCATPALCDSAGRAVQDAPACQPGQYSCDSAGDLQTCNASETGFTTTAACGSAALCNASAGKCNTAPCSPSECSGVQRRQPPAVQREPDRVDHRADVRDALPCATSPPRRATWPACTANEYQCAGAALDVCNAGRTGYVASTTCMAANLCDAADGRCDVCVPGSWSCSGAGLYHCASDGQTDPLSQTCATAAQCDPAAQGCDPAPPSDAGSDVAATTDAGDAGAMGQDAAEEGD